MSILFDEYSDLVAIIKNGTLDQFRQVIKGIPRSRMKDLQQLVPILRQEYGDKGDVFKKQIEMYQERLSRKQRVLSNIVDDNGISILQRAVEFKRPDIANYLIKGGADVNYMSNNQSILSFLVICSINDVDIIAEEYNKRFNKTAILLQHVDYEKINTNPDTVRDLIEQIKFSNDIEIYNCKSMKSKIKQFFPKVMLNVKESKQYKKLIDENFKQQCQQFNEECTRAIQEKLIDRDGFPKKIRSWYDVENVLVDFRKEAEKITKNLKLLKKYRIDGWFKFVLDSYFIDHLKAYVSHTFHIKEINGKIASQYIFDKSFVFHFMECKKKKLRVLLALGFPVYINEYKSAYYDCVDNLNEQEIKGGYADTTEYIIEKRDVFYNHKIECLKMISALQDIRMMAFPSYLSFGTNLKRKDLDVDDFMALNICRDLTRAMVRKADTFLSQNELMENMDFLLSFNSVRDGYFRLLVKLYSKNPPLIEQFMKMYAKYHRDTLNMDIIVGGNTVADILMKKLKQKLKF